MWHPHFMPPKRDHNGLFWSNLHIHVSRILLYIKEKSIEDDSWYMHVNVYPLEGGSQKSDFFTYCLNRDYSITTKDSILKF